MSQCGVVEGERRSRRSQERRRPLQPLAGVRRDAPPACERNRVLGQLSGEDRNRLVEIDHAPIARFALVGDSGEKIQSIGPEQRPLMGARQARRQLDRREAGRVSMIERLTKAANVVARDPFEPLCEPPMDLAPLLAGHVFERGCTNQVVAEAQAGGRLDRDPTRGERSRGVFDTRGRPSLQSCDVCERKRSGGDCEERHEFGGVDTRSAEPRSHELGCVAYLARAHERLEPERRAA
jgi:hypothetical protein